MICVTGGQCGTAAVRLTVTSSAPVTVEVRFAASSDDGVERADGSISRGSTDASIDGNISCRARTSAVVSWAPQPWTTRGEAGSDQQTPDIAVVIQEIVNRPNWSSGNSLTIIITGTGKRVVGSYNGDQAGAPLLHVEYTSGS